MTDAVIEANGNTMEEAFEYAAKGLCHTMINVAAVEPKKEVIITAEGHDYYSLLFDWLDKVMLSLVADKFALSEFIVKIAKNELFSVQATARGEPLDLDKHGYKVEIKAVTYHEMEIMEDATGARVKFLLDL